MNKIIAKNIVRDALVECDTKGKILYDKLPNNRGKLLRLSEILIASSALLLFSPIWLIIAILIKLSSKGSVFFVQSRSGYLGNSFNMYKFRSMKIVKENIEQINRQYDSERVTFIGKILRKFRLDEVPQLINVIKGEMNLIGPRPELPENSKNYAQIYPDYYKRLLVKPGITGYAQINQSYSDSLTNVEEKLNYDLKYVFEVTPKLDFYILINTVKTILLGNGG